MTLDVYGEAQPTVIVLDMAVEDAPRWLYERRGM
jgi:hypothetical protein